MMSKYFVKYIRFPLMDKNYFFHEIESSGVLNQETIDEIKQILCWNNNTNTSDASNKNTTIFDSNLSKTSDINNFQYDSEFCWYPRKPYYQFFLANYDICALSHGDKIAVSLKCGGYDELTINTISPIGQRFVRITYFEKPGNWYGYDINTIREEWFFASLNAVYAKCQPQSVVDNNCNNMVHMHPNTKDVCNLYKLGDKVEFRLGECDDEWEEGTIVRLVLNANNTNANDSDNYYNPAQMIWVFTQEEGIAYFHPWNFQCLRPIST